MALYSSLLSVPLTMLLLNPLFFTDENKTDAIAPGITITSSNSPTERLDFAAVDFCYRGSVVDPETGELVELYALCSDDAIGGNIDLA